MKEKSKNNRTIVLSDEERQKLTLLLSQPGFNNVILNQDIFNVDLPIKQADLLVLDPPYNLTKDYNGKIFNKMNPKEYSKWFESVLGKVLPVLKDTGTVYVCSDWETSIIIAPILKEHLHVRNRVTWEREKGRGSKSNWKNNTEDIWFCTVSDSYTFNVESVKLKKKVLAPYRNSDGIPKDWGEVDGQNCRMTYPSNIWTDITVPFWSMSENTDHPTQKPEKLIAKLVLASSNEGDLVFDPFLGSGTSAVVSRKLNRRFLGIERDLEYCCLAQKRLEMVNENKSIQGYSDGVFYERNFK